MVFAEGNGQLEYEQKHVYAGSERIEQFTDKGNWERTLYVHEDVMGNTRYYTKANGQSFAELTYDAWGMPESPNKLLNNDHGNYVFATFTGHIYDTTLDIYFAEARFYDANNRTWLAIDPIKDGGNWYQYCHSNPVIYMDADGEVPIILIGAGIGAVKGLVGNVIEQATDDKEFSWGELAVKTGAGTAEGAIATTGIPLLGLAVSNAAIDTIGEAAILEIRDEDPKPYQYETTAVVSFTSTLLSGALDLGLEKAAGKLYPTRYKTTDSLFRPTKDEALAEALTSVKIGGLGSFEWEIYKKELAEQLVTRVGRAAVDNFISTSTKGIFVKYLGS